jgi:hypothetical protein
LTFLRSATPDLEEASHIAKEARMKNLLGNYT